MSELTFKSESLEAYSQRLSTPEPAILRQIHRETHLTQVYPQMMAGHIQGLLIKMVVSMIRPHRILEIGTFTGYSAIAMGLAMKENSIEGQLHTIEVNPEQEKMIRKNIGDAGLEKCIFLHIGDATHIIPELQESWDLVFIDADKPGYKNYYNLVFPKVRSGGFILADNVLWDGKVTGNPDKMDKDTRGIVAFNEMVRNDPRVENLLLPIRDGLMIIRKIESES